MVGNVTATAFKVDYKGKVYLVTARNVVSALPALESTIQIQKVGTWQDFKVKKKLLPSSDSVDIAVFMISLGFFFV